MSYIASGKLRADLERTLGVSLVHAPEEPDDEDEDDEEDPLARFPAALRAELVALRTFTTQWSPPKLCVLSWGDFCAVPELTGEEREEVLEDWFDGDEAATDFVMKAVDVVNGGGGFYVVVNTDGRMGLVCEDPYSFDPLSCDLPQFLKALVAAHHAASTQGLEAAKVELEKVVDKKAAKLLLTFAKRLEPKPAPSKPAKPAKTAKPAKPAPSKTAKPAKTR